MSLSQEQVAQVALLARLEVQPAQVERYSKELSTILDLVDELQNAQVGDAEPMAHPMEMVQRMRADVVSETDRREVFQANSPAVDNGLFLVPKVIE